MAAVISAGVGSVAQADDTWVGFEVNLDWDEEVPYHSVPGPTHSGNYPPQMLTLPDGTSYADEPWAVSADSFNQNIHAYSASSTEDGSPVSSQANTEVWADYQNIVTVGAGSSGLEAGDAVTLDLTFSLSAVNTLAGTPAGIDGWSQFGAQYFDYFVSDAGSGDTLLWATGSHAASRWYEHPESWDGVSEPTEGFYHDYSHEVQVDWSTVYEDSDSISDQWHQEEGEYSSQAFEHDALIEVSFETFVGAELELYASMFNEAESFGDGYAIADALNSFGIDLAPGEGFEGVSLSYTVVPEPATGTLLLAGLLATLRRGRRGKA